MPFYSILSGVGVNLYTESLTEAHRGHKAPHRITSKGLDALHCRRSAICEWSQVPSRPT
jgi:hypothetical protein